jgi:acetyl esterase/lipase
MVGGALSACAIFTASVRVQAQVQHQPRDQAAPGVRESVRAPLRTPTLRQIMSDPQWIARSPENAYWSWDASAVLYDRARPDSRLSDLWSLDLGSGEATRVGDADLPFVSERGGVLDASRSRRVFSRSGDIFVRDMSTGELTQITRTTDHEHGAMFMGDGSIAFLRGGSWFIRDASTGLEFQAADIRTEDEPEEKDPDKGYLAEQQRRLFEIVRAREAREREREADTKGKREADTTRVPGPFYLGKGWRIQRRTLSPSGRWMLLSVSKDPGEGKRDLMPAWVNADGYVSTSPVRPKVGEEKRADERLVLLDLESRLPHHLDPGVLPTITEDPLAWLKAKPLEPGAPGAGGADGEAIGDEPADAGGASEPIQPPPPADPSAASGSESGEDKPGEARSASVQRIEWSPDGTRVAVMLRSNDNKDRWIATVDLEAEPPVLLPVHHLRDEAWINWRYNEMGWTADGRTLWYLSEESGYGHLYAWDAETGERRALTEGRFTVQDVTESPGGGVLYFRSNRRHPGTYDLERVRIADGFAEAITRMPGTVEAYDLSPDGARAVIRHSRAMEPPELFVLEARPGAEARRITETVSAEFLEYDWVAPRFVEVPSTHAEGAIHCRLYEDPSTPPPGDGGKPVVIFAHGAGYLQHVHDGWSNYFREHMFHTLLARAGYIVIAPDFRASAGYGRDWRTAIYRDMGRPELEDFDDCLAWLDANTGADTGRVGIYGGSYGGFLSLMAMFLRPEVYACGVALRPVTDWAHYNHAYTSNILNTPEVDPEAFGRSSPIEHAEGLAGALLMCHGLLDDNVVAQDTVRLAQRLIELEKENWEMALYPVEPHSFREATGWLDEYRRIFRLFEANLKD